MDQVWTIFGLADHGSLVIAIVMCTPLEQPGHYRDHVPAASNSIVSIVNNMIWHVKLQKDITSAGTFMLDLKMQLARILQLSEKDCEAKHAEPFLHAGKPTILPDNMSEEREEVESRSSSMDETDKEEVEKELTEEQAALARKERRERRRLKQSLD